jgi:hypothetical protein
MAMKMWQRSENGNVSAQLGNTSVMQLMKWRNGEISSAMSMAAIMLNLGVIS